jgi:hypothetical protein
MKLICNSRQGGSGEHVGRVGKIKESESMTYL